LLEAGRADEAEAYYRDFLLLPGLTESDEIAACVALITLLVDRAQHELGGKEEFHRRSQALLERGLPLARQQGSHMAVAEMLRLSWLIQFQQNKLDGSARLLLEALEELELAGASEKERSAIYSNLSYTYVLSGEFERAMAYQRHNVVRSMQGADPDQQSIDLYRVTRRALWKSISM
jgi:hypothetical protein